MRPMMGSDRERLAQSILTAAIVVVAALSGNGALAQDTPVAAPPPAAAASPPPATLHIAYLGQRITHPLPHSFLDVPPQDEGVAGARAGIIDDNTTGRFTGQNFVLDEAIVGEDGDVADAFKKLVKDGDRLVVTDLPAAA